MRIGFLLPANFAVGTRGNGILEQARRQAEALETIGHCVVRLNPWEWQDERELDVLHFYLGGPSMADVVEHRNLSKPGVLVFSPIIDSNQSLAAYRLAATLGNVSGRFFTVPGLLRRQALASHAVVCRSSHEAQRVTRGLGVAAEKVAIVLNGSPPCSSAADAAADDIRRKLDLPGEFVLHISAFTQERKNVLRLIDAAQRLRYPLVLAGTAKPGPVLTEIERRARGNERLRILGFIDEPTKAALYARCRVFCLPSTHEGTGLAALEAGAAGARVVITRNGGTRDYFGDHAEYVDPGSVSSIQEAIARAWHAPRDDRLRHHIGQQLSWSESGRSLERLYLALLGQQSASSSREPQRGADFALDSRQETSTL
jgi:glycosyltransferase involved in cell wall biosynthesis